MSALSAAKLLAAGTAWRLTGLDATGRTLITALTGRQPDDRMLAGILLTRAGDRAVTLIRDALATEADPTDLVNVLASIGTTTARAALTAATQSDRTDVATAARHAQQTLNDQNINPT